MLALETVDVFYGSAHVLHDWSLAIPEGEVVALVGRNGAGKSTALKAFAGLLGCRRGRRRLGDLDVTALGPEALNRLGIALVPEDRQIFPDLTVEENLRMAQVVRRAGPWDRERVYGLFPRLRERRRTAGQALSGGEQQMLCIARALLCCPRVLLLDEPTEGLAPIIVDGLADAIRDIAATGIGVLLVEQNVRVPARIASRFVVAEAGRVVWSGDAARFASEQAEVERLLSL